MNSSTSSAGGFPEKPFDPTISSRSALIQLSRDGRVIDCTGDAVRWWGAANAAALRGRTFASLFFFEAPATDEDPEIAAWKLIAVAAAARPMNLQARVDGGGFEATVHLAPVEDENAEAAFSAHVERSGDSFSVVPPRAEHTDDSESESVPEVAPRSKLSPETDEGAIDPDEGAEAWAQEVAAEIAVEDAVTPIAREETPRSSTLEAAMDGVAGATVGFFEVDFPARTARFSASWARLLGYDLIELSEESGQLAELFHPDDSEAAPAPHQTGEARARKALSVEARMQTNDGGWRWMQLEGVQQFDDEGRLAVVSGVMLDAQERHDMEDELIRGEERLRRLTGGGAGFFEIDFQTEAATFSQEFQRLLGYGSRGFGGTLDAFMKLLPPEDAEAGPDAFFRSLVEQREGMVSRYKLRHADGRLVPMETFLVVDSGRDGQVRRVTGLQMLAMSEDTPSEILRDGSDETKAVFGARRALDVVAQDVIVVDAQGRIRHANTRALTTARQTFDEIHGRLLTEVFQLVDRATEAPAVELLQRAVSSGEVIDLDHSYALVEEPGTSDVVVTCRPLFDRRKRVEGAVVVFRRPSEMPLSPAELVASNRMEALGRLACGLTHDFNNLLTTVTGGICLALETKEWDPLHPAQKACESAKKLAKQLLTFARGGVTRRRVQSLIPLIRDTAKMAGAGSNAAFEFDLPDDLHPVDVDTVQFVQVFTNLILNAVQMMPDGGKIGIRALNMPLGPINSVSLPPGDYVRVEVQDTGPGIPADMVERIFEPFFSTREGGTGLGLPMVRSIIAQHDGAIEAASTVGNGTTFTFYLPRASQAEMEEARKPMAVVSGTGRVLVMDDDEDLCSIVKGMLEVLGYEAETASTAEQAIACFKRYRHMGRHYAAVILDMTMPGGPGGEEVLAELRQIDPSVKAIVSSGYASEEHEKKYREAGFDCLLAKPFRSADLSNALKELTTVKA